MLGRDVKPGGQLILFLPLFEEGNQNSVYSDVITPISGWFYNLIMLKYSSALIIQ